MTTKLRPAARLGDLQGKFNQLKAQSTRGIQENEHLVTLAILGGEDLILNRNAKGWGTIGDIIKPDKKDYEKYLILARQGGIITKQSQENARELQRLKPILEKCEKPKERYANALTQASHAAATVHSLEAQLEAARNEYAAAVSAEQTAEKELEKILDEAGID